MHRESEEWDVPRSEIDNATVPLGEEELIIIIKEMSGRRLNNRADEIKERWYKHDIVKMVDRMVAYLREGVIRSVSELQQDLTPRLRAMMARPEREMVRGFLKWFFEKQAPRVLRGVKQVLGKMLTELVRYKVIMELHLYSGQIKEASP